VVVTNLHEGGNVMLEKPLGTVRNLAIGAVKRPIGLGLAGIGRTIGLARGSRRAVSAVLSGHPGRPPEESDRLRSVTPPPTDVAAEAPAPPEEPSADQVPVEEPDLVTPVGTPAADVGHNPDTTDTDLQQPGTEPIMDPATTKAVASEAATLGRAADPDKG
jgi:hypothetical protein